MPSPSGSWRRRAPRRASAHPNLVHVYDSGSDSGLHFIVMELLEEYRSLRERLAAAGPLAVAETLDLGSQLLDGVAAVHAAGLVHCDVKAGNVLLGPGPLKLIDLGIARVRDEGAGAGISIGSLGYMSPEQLRDQPLGPPSDLFAVGVVLYEALTGELPYRGSDPEEMAAAHRAGPPRPPSQLRPEVPARFDDAILQALQPAPERRFGTAAAMRHALQSVTLPPATGAATEETTQVRAVVRTEAPDSTFRRSASGRPVQARAPSRPAGRTWPGLGRATRHPRRRRRRRTDRDRAAPPAWGAQRGPRPIGKLHGDAATGRESGRRARYRGAEQERRDQRGEEGWPGLDDPVQPGSVAARRA